MINNNKNIKNTYIDKIDDQLLVRYTIIKVKNDEFIEISLFNSDIEIFIGRFPKENYKLEMKYLNDNLIFYYINFIRNINQLKAIKVLALYNILDDTFYAVTEKDALNLFDNKIDTSYLIDKNNLIIRSDIEKKKRLRLKSF